MYNDIKVKLHYYIKLHTNCIFSYAFKIFSWNTKTQNKLIQITSCV